MSRLHPLFSEERYSGIYVVPGTPVLYISAFNAIVFSDLHLGFEEAAARGLDYSSSKTSYVVGMFIPRIQLRRIVETLDRVFEILSPNKVIINGDIKHAFDRLLKQERQEVKKLLDYLVDKGVEDIVLIRGNHDNYLPIVLRDYGLELHLKYELITSNYSMLITHGHLDIDISDYDLVVIGHEHPSLRCLGSLRSPAFLKIPFKNNGEKYIVCLPAIGPYHPGTQVSLNSSNYLSPIIQKYGLVERASVIIWLELGKYIGDDRDNIEFEYMDSFFEENVMSINRYVISDQEYAIIEFSDLEKALTICGFF